MQGFLRGQICEYCRRPSEECAGRCTECESDVLYIPEERVYRCDCGSSIISNAPRAGLTDGEVIYQRFVAMALRGEDNRAVDRFLREHAPLIKAQAAVYHREFPIRVGRVYRGLLCDPKKDIKRGQLQPMRHATYLSFSTSRDFALRFASRTDIAAITLAPAFPHFRGFLIEYEPLEEEILFHHQWIGRMPTAWPWISLEVVREQREVILEQRFRKFQARAV